MFRGTRLKSVVRIASVATVLIWSATAIFLAENAVRLPLRNRTPHLASTAMAEVQAKDGILLRAWTQEPRSWNGKAVILLHGVGDSHDGTTGPAAMFARNGYRTLSPDSRGHGSSEGETFSYGVQERDDIVRWIDWMDQHWKPTQIFGHGASMGASILLQTMPMETRLKAVIADCPFATFRAVAYHRVIRAAGLFFAPSVEPALFYSRFRFGIDLGDASPERAMSTSSTPVLLIHGEVDENIPVDHSLRLAEVRQGKNCELWKVKGAAHVACYRTAPAEYEKRTLAFLETASSSSAKVPFQP